MIPRKKKICVSCEKEKYIYAKKMCMGCYGRAQKGKTNETKKNKRVSVLNNELSEIDIYNEIWSERVHRSEVSGEPLLPKGHPMWHWCFSHLLGKGAYPKFKYDKRNIILKTPDEHILWQEHKHKIRDNSKWKWVFELEEALKQEYFQGK